jgi:MFS family permease
MRRAIEFLGLRRSIVGLLSVVILVGMGERMAERFVPLYLMVMGGGAMAVSLFNGLNNLLGAVYSLPGGLLAQRLGTKRSLLVFNLMAICGYLIVVLVPAWQAVIVGGVFFLAWSAISLPATMDLVAGVLPRSKRTMGVSMHSLIRRIPMALGPLVGGAFINVWGRQTGVRTAFAAALGIAVVAVAVQMRMIEDDRPDRRKRAAAREGLHPMKWLRLMSPELRSLLVSDVLIRFCEQIPYAFVVIWCTDVVSGRISALEFGLLTSIEMATAVLVYIPVAYFADRAGKKPFVVATFVFFTLFPLALLFCRSFWALVPAFVLRGLKEFGEPTRKALIMDLAPADAKAVTFGVYYLVRDSVVSVAAFLGGFLWMYGPHVNFLTAFAFGAIGTIWFALRGRDLGAPAAAGEVTAV